MSVGPNSPGNSMRLAVSCNTGLLKCDADEIYCKTLTGQCNVYSLHVIDGSSKTSGGDWILVVTLFGKVYRFSINTEADRKSSNDGLVPPKIASTEFDLRNEFPSQYADLEVASSCVFSNVDDEAYLFLACVDNRSHLSDSSASGSGVEGLIIIVKVAPPWKGSAPLARIVRTIATTYSPTLLVSFPLRRRIGDSVDDYILFVSGNDRSMHGYRVETNSTNSGSPSKSRGTEIATCECFLGETSAEFDAFLRRGKPLPGTIIQLAVWDGLHRLTALGFDTGHVSICQVDLLQNQLIGGPVECHFDTPITSLKFLTTAVPDSTSGSSDSCLNCPSLLVCPAIGPARLYTRCNASKWTDSPMLTLACSDQFDCITCAESITVPSEDSSNSITYILLGTFAGKVLIYLINRDMTSITLKRVHSLLSPVMSIRRFAERYVAIMLMYTIMIFEL